MEVLLNELWIIFIIITFFNVNILKKRTRKYIDKDPKLEEGYKKYFRNYLILFNIPWVIMGVGNTLGMTEHVFEYLSPAPFNPMVYILHIYIIIVCVLGIKWIYFSNGAEFLESHPGLTRKTSMEGEKNMSAGEIRVIIPLILLTWIVVIIINWILSYI